MSSKKKTSYYLSLSRLVQKEYYPDVLTANILSKTKKDKSALEFVSDFGDTGEFQVNSAYKNTKKHYLAGLPDCWIDISGYTPSVLQQTVQQTVERVYGDMGENPRIVYDKISLEGLKTYKYIAYMLKRDFNYNFDGIRDYVKINNTYYEFDRYFDNLKGCVLKRITTLYQVTQVTKKYKIVSSTNIEDTVEITTITDVHKCLPKTSNRIYIHPNLDNYQNSVSYLIPEESTSTTEVITKTIDKGTERERVETSNGTVSVITLTDTATELTFDFKSPCGADVKIEAQHFSNNNYSVYLPGADGDDVFAIDYQPTPIWSLRNEGRDLTEGYYDIVPYDTPKSDAEVFEDTYNEQVDDFIPYKNDILKNQYKDKTYAELQALGLRRQHIAAFPEAYTNTNRVLKKIGFPVKDLINGYHGREWKNGQNTQSGSDPTSDVTVDQVYVMLGLSHNGDIMDSKSYDDMDPMVSKLLYLTVENIYNDLTKAGISCANGQEVSLNIKQYITWNYHDIPQSIGKNEQARYFYDDGVDGSITYNLKWGFYTPFELDNDSTVDDMSLGDCTRFKDTNKTYFRKTTIKERHFLRTEKATKEEYDEDSHTSIIVNGYKDIYQTVIYVTTDITTSNNTDDVYLIAGDKSSWSTETKWSFQDPQELETGTSITAEEEKQILEAFKKNGAISTSVSCDDSYEESFFYAVENYGTDTKPNVPAIEKVSSTYLIKDGCNLFLKKKIGDHKSSNIVMYNITGIMKPSNNRTWNIAPLQEYMIWPLSMRAWNRLTIIEKTKAYNDIWYMQLFMHKTTYVKWYQTGLFSVFLVVIMIVIVVVVCIFCPPCAAALAAAASEFIAGLTISSLLLDIAVALAVSIAVQVSLKWIVRHTSGFLKYALMSAVVAAAVYVGIVTGGSTFSAITSSVNYTAQALQEDITYKMDILQHDAKKFLEELDTKSRALSELENPFQMGITPEMLTGINASITAGEYTFTPVIDPSLMLSAQTTGILDVSMPISNLTSLTLWQPLDTAVLIGDD